jgi:hypothetical protein
MECSGTRPPAQKIPIARGASVFASPLAGERIKVRGGNYEARRFVYWRAIPHRSPLPLRKGEAINPSPPGLMRGGPLLSVIIVYDKASVNDSWNPAK